MKIDKTNVDEVQPFGLIKTVYSYPPPEVRNAINETYARHIWDVLRMSVKPAGFEQIFKKAAKTFGLDTCEQPVIDRAIDFLSEHIAGLSTYPYRYWTAGAHEGISEFQTFLASLGAESINVFSGDYEGFSETAKTRRLVADAHELDGMIAERFSAQEKFWFISNPSALDGNYLPEGLIPELLEGGNKIFLDVSYVPSSTPRRMDVSHPNIEAVAMSFSKPFGGFYFRSGILFSRQAVPSLYGNRWFKSVPAIVFANLCMDALNLGEYVFNLKTAQEAIVRRINSTYGLSLMTSDSFLLACRSSYTDATLSPESREIFALFRRSNRLRFCLTPHFLADDSEWMKELFEFFRQTKN